MKATESASDRASGMESYELVWAINLHLLLEATAGLEVSMLPF